MQHIVSLSDVTHRLHQDTNAFLQWRHIDAKPITLAQAFRMCYAVMEDMVCAEMQWCAPSHMFEQTVKELMPWFNVSGEIVVDADIDERITDEQSCLYLNKVLDRIDMQIATLVDDIIPDQTWYVWSMKPATGYHVFLIKGDDWRALQYEQIMAKRRQPKPDSREHVEQVLNTWNRQIATAHINEPIDGDHVMTDGTKHMLFDARFLFYIVRKHSGYFLQQWTDPQVYVQIITLVVEGVVGVDHLALGKAIVLMQGHGFTKDSIITIIGQLVVVVGTDIQPEVERQRTHEQALVVCEVVPTDAIRITIHNDFSGGEHATSSTPDTE